MRIKPRKGLYILILFLLFRFISFAQDKSSNSLFIDGNYQYGMIWQHKPSMADIIGGNINVIKLSVGKKTLGKSKWDQLFRYPDWGMGLYVANLGNNEELGYSNSLYGYLNVPLIKRRNFQIRYRISGGLAYLNQGNSAIGSHVNCYFDASIDTRIKLIEKLFLINAIGATHFSNGAIKTPNLGLNLFSYRLGLHYDLGSTQVQVLRQVLPEIEKKNNISTVINWGVKQLKNMGAVNYLVTSGIIDYQRRIGYKHKIGAGIDIFYDQSLFKTMNPDTDIKLSNSDIMRYGIHLSAESRIYNFVLAVYFGTYLHTAYTKDGKIYQRVAIRYLFTESLFANISLKTSAGVADFVEWGIGYQFLW